MSLLLRKACQPTLNNYGLGEFHVDINSDKRLCILTTCGRPITVVKGIQFNKTSLSLAEIAYAGELFEDYLERHAKEISDYLNAYEHYHSLPRVSSNNNGYGISSYSEYDIITFKSGIFRLKYTIHKGKKRKQDKELTITSTSDGDVRVIVSSHVNVDDCMEAIGHYEKYITYVREGDHLQTLGNKLSSCDI